MECNKHDRNKASPTRARAAVPSIQQVQTAKDRSKEDFYVCTCCILGTAARARVGEALLRSCLLHSMSTS